VYNPFDFSSNPPQITPVQVQPWLLKELAPFLEAPKPPLPAEHQEH
jgi:hypothetical protein